MAFRFWHGLPGRPAGTGPAAGYQRHKQDSEDYQMSKLKKLGTAGAVGVMLSGGLIFASSQAANAVTCSSSTAPPTSTLAGTKVVAATSFEGSIVPFVQSTAGTGTATVTSSKHQKGLCSVKLHVTADSGSIAKMSAPLSSGTKTASADGWFNITTAGVAGNDVPYLRFFSGGNRIADIYRYNSNGQLWLRVTNPGGTTFTYTKLKSSSIPLNTWHHAQMTVTANGSQSTIKVWFDGAAEYSSSVVNLGVTSLSAVQLGAEHARQMGDEYIDDVVVRAS
jgi:hypothetical protein